MLGRSYPVRRRVGPKPRRQQPLPAHALRPSPQRETLQAPPPQRPSGRPLCRPVGPAEPAPAPATRHARHPVPLPRRAHRGTALKATGQGQWPASSRSISLGGFRPSQGDRWAAGRRRRTGGQHETRNKTLWSVSRAAKASRTHATGTAPHPHPLPRRRRRRRRRGESQAPGAEGRRRR